MIPSQFAPCTDRHVSAPRPAVEASPSSSCPVSCSTSAARDALGTPLPAAPPGSTPSAPVMLSHPDYIFMHLSRTYTSMTCHLLYRFCEVCQF